MNKLFSEFTLKDMHLKNRIVMPAIGLFCAKEDGKLTNWHMDHYITRAMGGVALIIIEATGILPDSRLSRTHLGLWSDEQISGMKSLANRVHEYGSKIGIQLAYGSGNVVEQAKSVNYCNLISEQAINEILEAFKAATKRALAAELDFIEIHGAHSTLISTFLSPVTNKRTDKWGGSIENRSLFLELVIKKVREVWPQEKPLGLRVSATDYCENGITQADIDYVVTKAKELGVDIIDVSTGHVVPVSIDYYPGYQVKYANVIRRNNNIPVMAGGLITTGELADNVLEEEKADLVYIGRELLRNPYWPLQVAKDFNNMKIIPKQYISSFNQ